MGKKYEVICLNVGGKSNKIFTNKDLVDENDFEEGVAEQLVKSKHLKPATKAQSDKLKKAETELSKKDKAESEEKVAKIKAEKEKRALAKKIINLEGKVKECKRVSESSDQSAKSIAKDLAKDKGNASLKKVYEKAAKRAEHDAKFLKEAEEALEAEKKAQEKGGK